MKKHLYILTFLAMTLNLFSCACTAQAPKGTLTYCSYSESGSAGLGKDYCELIADEGTEPKVVVALHLNNRFDDPEIHAEYPVGPEVVAELQELLAQNKVYKLDGYDVEEAITGGYAHRIHIEYSSGRQVTARWYATKVKDSAWSAYRMIERFFTPWRERAEKENN